MFIADPGSRAEPDFFPFRIPDPGVKKAPDPGIRNTVVDYCIILGPRAGSCTSAWPSS